MNFIKLVLAEIKKIILKPSMLILIGLLIAALCISGFTYNPTNKNTNVVSITGETVTVVKSKFYSNSGTYTKQNYDERFHSEINGAYAYIINSSKDNTYVKGNLVSILTQLNQSYENFINNADETSTELLKSYIDSLKSDLSLYENEFKSSLSSSVPQIIIKNNLYLEIQKIITDTNYLLNSITSASSVNEYTILKNKLINSNVINNINTLTNNIVVVKIPQEVNSYLNDIYNAAILKCNTQNDIINNYSDSSYSLVIKKFNVEISKYFDIQSQAHNIIKTTYINNLADDITKYFGYTDFNIYQNNSNLLKNKYLFNNNLYSFEVADVFNPHSTSNTITNGFDFTFNTLQIIMFVIILYSIIIATSCLANEYSNGTIKLVLVRPYSRNKILSAKIIAIILTSSLFIVLSCIISMIIGAIMFGMNSAPILLVFSSFTAGLINPFVLIVIYLLTCLFKCSIYILLTILISIIFRNPIPAISIGLGIYFAGLISNMFISSYWWAMILPFPNFDLFNYFMPTTTSVQIGNLFTGNYQLKNIFISLIYDIFFIAALLFPSYKIFKNNDI